MRHNYAILVMKSLRCGWLKILLLHLYIPMAAGITFAAVTILRGNYGFWAKIAESIPSFAAVTLIAYFWLLALGFNIALRLHPIALRRRVQRLNYKRWLILSPTVFIIFFSVWDITETSPKLASLVGFAFTGSLVFPAADSLSLVLMTTLKAIRVSRQPPGQKPAIHP